MRIATCIFFLGTVIATGATHADHAFKLNSADALDNQPLKPAQVFNGFGCHGGNRSPQLEWSGAPAGTKSFAVTIYDPDAPTGSGWWHWVVYNLPASASKLDAGVGQQGKLPPGAEHGRNDYGRFDFGGACPPEGDKPHRYVFTVHALKVDKIEVPKDASAALIGYMINANRIGAATLTATYGR
ncbi:MAG TPA: YbhB/YbcL family Raf kinase inhibitor-like protein [Noviherbaspirillum sp.]